jgi:hypothetical protein
MFCRPIRRDYENAAIVPNFADRSKGRDDFGPGVD